MIIPVRNARFRPRAGFTTAELMLGLLITAVCLLAISGVLAADQRAWLNVYNRVYGNVATGVDVARRTFDGLVREGSKTNSLVDADGTWLEVQYYSSASVSGVDRFARFYVSNNSLKVDYGPISPRQTDTTQVLCGNVTSCVFLKTGASAQMALTLNDGNHTATVTTSAVLHAQ